MDDAAGRQFTSELDSGDVWPDLLARVGATIDPESTPIGLHAESRRGGKPTANHCTLAVKLFYRYQDPGKRERLAN